MQVCLLLVSDAFLASTSWISAYWIRRALNPIMQEPINPFEGYLHALPWIVMLWIVSCTAFGLYHRHSSQIEEFGYIIKAVFLNLLIAMAVTIKWIIIIIYKIPASYIIDISVSVIIYSVIWYFTIVNPNIIC